MNLGKTALLVLFCGLVTQSVALAESKYWQEFKELRENPSHKLVFDKESSSAVKGIAKDLENAKEVGIASRFMRPLIWLVNGVVINEETMPKLYRFIDTLCKVNRIATPVITITQSKGIFNAAAQKLLMTSGAIFIGQDMLKELNDEEIEAIVAHEIGHIYHNHVNKMVGISLIRWYVLSTMANRGIILPTDAIAYHLFMPYLLLGKRFERQADEFACREANRANGIASSFKYMLQKEEKHDADFDQLYTALKNGSSDINVDDAVVLWTRYCMAKVGHKFESAMKWIYHNTPFGPHPSHEERIDNAKRILAEQEAYAA